MIIFQFLVLYAIFPILRVIDYFKRRAKRRERKIEKHIERLRRHRSRRRKRQNRKQRAKEKLAAEAAENRKMSKKQHRIEKKKRKLAALVNIVQLNDKDRIVIDNSDNDDTAVKHKVVEPISEVLELEAHHACNKTKKSKKQRKKQHDIVEDNNAKSNAVNGNDDGFIKVTYHKKSRKNSASNKSSDNDELKPKRAKLTTTTTKTIAVAAEDIKDASTTAATPEFTTALLTDEQYKDLQRQLQHRKQELKQVPILHFHEMGNRALLSLAQDQRTPIFSTDIQHLLMSVMLQGKSPCQTNRWCHIEQAHAITHTVVLIIEGMSLYHYHAYESLLERTKGIFELCKMEMVVPYCEKGSILKELSQVPLVMMESQQLIDSYGSLDAALDMEKDPTLLVKPIFPMDKSDKETEEKTSDLHPDDKFPRTKLLLSAMQMVDEGYPMPLRGELGERFKDYKYTKNKYSPVTNKSPMYGIDCEMCLTVNAMNELTRISVVNEKMETLYETLVRPRYKIVDYLTRFSGITADMMIKATKTLNDVQQDIQNLLPSDAILVGQSLNSDLNAMQMMHPYVIDTSVCFNLTGNRKRKSKLKVLSETFLKELIQENIDGHDSVEDSIATLKLVKLKLTEGLDFGDEILLRKKRYQEVLRNAANEMNKANAISNHYNNDKIEIQANKMVKSVGMVSRESCLEEQLKTTLKQANENALKNAKTKESSPAGIGIYEYPSNKEVIKKTREIMLDHALNLSNINVQIDGQDMEGVESTIKKVDKYINKLWKSVANNGMFIVLMGGSSECPSGLAQIAFKKKPALLTIAEEPATTVTTAKTE